jgi:hypothetical protein
VKMKMRKMVTMMVKKMIKLPPHPQLDSWEDDGCDLQDKPHGCVQSKFKTSYSILIEKNKERKNVIDVVESGILWRIVQTSSHLRTRKSGASTRLSEQSRITNFSPIYFCHNLSSKSYVVVHCLTR